MPDGLPLNEALRNLRDELRSARLESDDSVKLRIKDIQLELTVQIDRARDASVGVGLWKVVTGNGGLKHSESHLHKLMLTIEPLDIKANGESDELLLSREAIARD